MPSVKTGVSAQPQLVGRVLGALGGEGLHVSVGRQVGARCPGRISMAQAGSEHDFDQRVAGECAVQAVQLFAAGAVTVRVTLR